MEGPKAFVSGELWLLEALQNQSDTVITSQRTRGSKEATGYEDSRCTWRLLA
jgi:hypothetical protein